MRHLLASLLVAALLAAAGTRAADRPVVVELFTSQGCPSCPPADRFLQDLAAREDVLALSLHVDYWDYIGWEDSLASPANTARQRGYAQAGGRKMVYTPQIIVNGTDPVVGTRFEEVTALIDRHAAAPSEGIALGLRREAAALHVTAQATTPRDRPLVVQLARYLPEATVTIAHGENAGRTITYVNVVTALVELAEWDTRSPLDLRIPWPEDARDAPAAVLLQYPGFGAIAAAARLR